MAFSAEKFMQGTSAPMSTITVVCPEGEYKAIVDDGDKAVSFRDGDPSKNLSPQGVFLCSILDDAVKAQLKRDKILVPYNCWLDLEGDELDLSEGKNVKLGKLRAAIDQNGPGTWNPLMAKGKGPFMVKVTQRSDRVDPTIKFAEISRISKIS